MPRVKDPDSKLADAIDYPQIGNAQTLIADLAAITGGESPTEAEHNLVVTKVNAILDLLEYHGLMKDA